MANSNLKWQKKGEKGVFEGNNPIWKAMKKDYFWEYREKSRNIHLFKDENTGRNTLIFYLLSQTLFAKIWPSQKYKVI